MPLIREKETPQNHVSLPDSPNMTDKILNDPLERLLLTEQAIPALQPVLQQRTGAQGDLLQFGDVLRQLCVRQTAERGVRGRAQPAD